VTFPCPRCKRNLDSTKDIRPSTGLLTCWWCELVVEGRAAVYGDGDRDDREVVAPVAALAESIGTALRGAVWTHARKSIVIR